MAEAEAAIRNLNEKGINPGGVQDLNSMAEFGEDTSRIEIAGKIRSGNVTLITLGLALVFELEALFDA